MPKLEHEPPSLANLESRFRFEARADLAIIVALVLLNAYITYVLMGLDSLGVRIIGALSLAGSWVIYHLPMLRYFTQGQVRVRNLKWMEKVGNFKAEAIQEMARELFEPHRRKRREIPAIMITENKNDGAYVIDSLFFNFLTPLNAVYISKRLFSVLEMDEIKAILSHELGHFYRYMRPLNRVRFLVGLANGLLPLYLSNVFGGVSFGEVLIFWIVVTASLQKVLNLWMIRVSRINEHLSDAHAARRYGILNFINGLIVLLKQDELRSLLQKRVLEKVMKDSTYSAENVAEIFDEVESRLPAGAFGIHELENCIDEAFASHRVLKLKKRLSKHQLKIERQKIETFVGTYFDSSDCQVLDWSEFDNVTPNGKICEREYPRLIEALRRNPDGQLFNLISDNREFARTSTHPTVGERILFLEKCGYAL